MRWLVGILIIAVVGCAMPQKPMPEGEPVNPPIGYMLHCIEYPDSPFCKEAEP